MSRIPRPSLPPAPPFLGTHRVDQPHSGPGPSCLMEHLKQGVHLCSVTLGLQGAGMREGSGWRGYLVPDSSGFFSPWFRSVPNFNLWYLALKRSNDERVRGTGRRQGQPSPPESQSLGSRFPPPSALPDWEAAVAEAAAQMAPREPDAEAGHTSLPSALESRRSPLPPKASPAPIRPLEGRDETETVWRLPRGGPPP